MSDSTPNRIRPRRLSTASEYTRTDQGDDTTTSNGHSVGTQQDGDNSSMYQDGMRSQARSNVMTGSTTSDEIDRLEQKARSSFLDTMQPFLNRSPSSKAPSMLSQISSAFIRAVNLSSSLKSMTAQDRNAQQLDALIIKHKEAHGMGMAGALMSFKAIVPIAWKCRDSASAKQRQKIKDFLKQVLRNGVSFRSEEFEPALTSVIYACDHEAVEHKCFYRLCFLWFDMFLLEDDEQSSTLGSKVADFLRNADAAEKEDLARLWKFTHTKY
jgi:hypothetical protein